MAFKDNFRIEKIYFQRVKDDAQILGSWKNDPRRYSREEIVRVAKDACDSILMLYRLIGECWNDALNQIEKLGAELEALAGKAEAYHDELNEKIDEVNNYLNTQIKNLEIRVENIENSIEDFGGLPSNENANEGDVLTVGENHVNEWTKPKGVIYLDANWDSETETEILSYNNENISVPEIYNYIVNGYEIKVKLNSFFNGNLSHSPQIFPLETKPYLTLFSFNNFNNFYQIVFKSNDYPFMRLDHKDYPNPVYPNDIESFILTCIGNVQVTRVKVYFNKLIGFDFIIGCSGVLPQWGADAFFLVGGLTLKERLLLYGVTEINNGFITYYDSSTNRNYSLPMLFYSLTSTPTSEDADKMLYRVEIGVYDVRTSTTESVFWEYNEYTDTERIYQIAG